MRALRSRIYAVSAMLCLLLLLVTGRLVMVQVVHRGEYSERSRQQALQRRVVRAVRGRILDCRGRELAVSVDDGGWEIEGERPARRAGRIYPRGDMAGPLLGFVGRDGEGQGGAELAFDRVLRGEDGWTIVQRDAHGKKGARKYHVDQPAKPPVNGADVYLTIDADMQAILQQVLRQARERYGARSAMGMVVEPASGAVLAMANEPSFNPNTPSRFAMEDRANRCVAENYEPGSTFKLVAAAAALDQRLFRESDTISGGNGVYHVYDQTIRDHAPFGRLTFAEALAFSSNVCFAKIADRLGSETFYRYTRNFGFGERTGIALPGEEAGIVHPVREWSGRTRVTMAIGHEVSATLLQMMMMYAAVANDGVLVQPRICSKVMTASGRADSTRTRPLRRVVSVEVAARLRAMLREVVTVGTGVKAAVDGVMVAGKTGTSNKFDKETHAYVEDRNVASFVGFAPVDKPVLLCGIVLDEPDSAKSGGLSAAPAFQQVLRQVISHPDLAYAQRLLGQDRPAPALAAGRSKVRTVPLVSGMSVRQAEERLKTLGIACEVIGTADTVSYQSPVAGRISSAGLSVKLFADDQSERGYDAMARVAVPECRGQDLRDALSLLRVRRLTPFVVGAGRVTEQRPAVGALVTEAAVCSLFCSFGS